MAAETQAQVKESLSELFPGYLEHVSRGCGACICKSPLCSGECRPPANLAPLLALQLVGSRSSLLACKSGHIGRASLGLESISSLILPFWGRLYQTRPFSRVFRGQVLPENGLSGVPEKTLAGVLARIATTSDLAARAAFLKAVFAEPVNVLAIVKPGGNSCSAQDAATFARQCLAAARPASSAVADGLSLLIARMLPSPELQDEDMADLFVFALIALSEKCGGDRTDSLLQALASSYAEQPGLLQNLLADRLSALDEALFGALVALLGQLVSRSCAGQIWLPAPAQQLVRLISVLAIANELAFQRSGAYIVPASAFYRADLSQRLDLKRIYSAWRQREGAETILEFPFLLEIGVKTRVLRIDAVAQMSQLFQNAFVHQAWVFQAQKIKEARVPLSELGAEVQQATNPYLVLDVRRERLVEDAMSQLLLKRGDVKKPLKVRYVGGGEHGLDLGGVQKEFFQHCMAALFDPRRGLFEYVEETHTMWLAASAGPANVHESTAATAPAASDVIHRLTPAQEFELAGMLVGLAIYNGVILDVQFPRVLYAKLLLDAGRWEETRSLRPLPHQQQLSLSDLRGLQPRLAQSLQQVLDYDGDVDDLSFSFQIVRPGYRAPLEDSAGDDVGHGGEAAAPSVVVDLVEDGGNVPVTNDNCRRFVELYVHELLVASVGPQFDAFSRGFHSVCGGPVLGLCSPDELEMLVCGSPRLDFVQLERAAKYSNGFTASSTQVRWLWAAVHSMSPEDQRRFLNFVTGSDRAPVQGLGKLAVTIQRNGDHGERLPTALTCFSRLLLPEYSTEAALRERLMLAIQNCRGFGLV